MRNVAFLAVVIGAMPMKAQERRTMTVGQLLKLVESNSNTLLQQKTSVEFASKEIDAARSQRLSDINTNISVSYNGHVLIANHGFSDAHGCKCASLQQSVCCRGTADGLCAWGQPVLSTRQTLKTNDDLNHKKI